MIQDQALAAIEENEEIYCDATNVLLYMGKRIIMPKSTQALADELTSKVLEEIYGDRFRKLDVIEEDDDINRDWECLNEDFYDLLENYFPKEY